MVPGYPQKPGDWAVTMAPPGWIPNPRKEHQSRGEVGPRDEDDEAGGQLA